MNHTITGADQVSGCILSNISCLENTHQSMEKAIHIAYLHFKSRSITSLETYSCYARKPRWLSKLECCRSMLWSEDSRVCPSSAKMLICSSSCVSFLSDDRIILTRLSKHLKLLESIASSTSFVFSLLHCWLFSNGTMLEVSNSLLFDPRSFLGWSLKPHYEPSFLLFGE